MRWENCLFACVAVAIGFASAHPPRRAGWNLVVAAVVVVLVLAFGNVANDLLDEESDRRSKPWRPLPSGRVRRPTAVRLALGLTLASVLVAVPLGLVPLSLTLLMLGLAYWYSARLKPIPLLGNVTVAVQVGSTILFGALAAGRPSGVTAVSSLLLWLYSLSLEVAKTVEDKDADRAAGVETIAHVVDPEQHGTMIMLLAVTCGVVAIGTGMARETPVHYWLVVAPLVPLAWLAFRLRLASTPPAVPVGGLVRASKALWILGLFGLAALT